MVQNAVVKKIVGDGVAEVSLLRQMECGLHCDGACAGCTQRPKEEILALASNPIGARPGDVVEVEPTGGHNLVTPVVVFLLPCVGLVAGYLPGDGGPRGAGRICAGHPDEPDHPPAQGPGVFHPEVPELTAVCSAMYVRSGGR